MKVYLQKTEFASYIYIEKNADRAPAAWRRSRADPHFVCEGFSRWFRRRFGESADLRDVWEAIDRPGWMLWVTTRYYVPAELRCLMIDCLNRIRAVGPFSIGEARREPALARQLRLVMPGELLEALLSEEAAR